MGFGWEILEGTPKDPLKNNKYIYIYGKSDGVIFNGSGGHDDHTMWDYKFCWPGAVQQCFGFAWDMNRAILHIHKIIFATTVYIYIWQKYVYNYI